MLSHALYSVNTALGFGGNYLPKTARHQHLVVYYLKRWDDADLEPSKVTLEDHGGIR